MNKREYQKNFEMSLLFPDTAKGIEVGENCLAVDKHKRYTNPHIEAAYLGYAMARRSDHSRLRRFEPERHIGQGMLTVLRERLGYEVPEETIRAVLQIAGELPA